MLSLVVVGEDEEEVGVVVEEVDGTGDEGADGEDEEEVGTEDGEVDGTAEEVEEDGVVADGAKRTYLCPRTDCSPPVI